MKNKKIITLALATALTVSTLTPAFANPALVIDEISAADSVIVSQEEKIEFVETIGVVQETNVQEQYIMVKTEQDIIQFNLSDHTWLVDGQNGTPLTLAELAGKEVVISHSEAMTKSLPAQSYAYAVITKGDMFPNYAVVEAVDRTEDGACLTIRNGGVLVTVTDNAHVTPFRTRNIVKMQDLQPGDQVVLYYDLVTLSYPGQAVTDRVVLLQAAEETTVSDNLVSLRDAIDGMGFQIRWNADSQTVTLQKDAFSATIIIGNENYGINKMRVLAQAPELRNGRTYVSQNFVDTLFETLQA